MGWIGRIMKVVSDLMADKNDIVELASWDTPFKGKDLEILSVSYGVFDHLNLNLNESPELLVRVQCLVTKNIYQVHFDNVGAFRVLDEHGLQEIISFPFHKGIKSTFPALKVRKHGWSTESPLSFFMGTDEGWSYMIMTGWDCVEVLTRDEPVIVLEVKVT